MGRTTLRLSLPSYFFTLWTVVQTQILQINILPNLFLQCQIANKIIAYVWDNKFVNGRSWTSYTSRYYTQIEWRTCMNSELNSILGTPRYLWKSVIFLIHCICSISLLETTTWRLLTLIMEERSADMESSCEYIKYK